jgi:hypothetical protein
MDKAEEYMGLSENTKGQPEVISYRALQSIASSLIVANELEYMKVSMMQREIETQKTPKSVFKTMDGKELEL